MHAHVEQTTLSYPVCEETNETSHNARKGVHRDREEIRRSSFEACVRSKRCRMNTATDANHHQKSADLPSYVMVTQNVLRRSVGWG